MKVSLSFYLASIALIISFMACSMGGRSTRLRVPVDEHEIYWYPCTKEMTKDWTDKEYEGKFCLVECVGKLKKDGTCSKDEYKYPFKEFKKNHKFFEGRYILIRQDQVF
jgi:hypothetical protein